MSSLHRLDGASSSGGERCRVQPRIRPPPPISFGLRPCGWTLPKPAMLRDPHRRGGQLDHLARPHHPSTRKRRGTVRTPRGGMDNAAGRRRAAHPCRSPVTPLPRSAASSGPRRRLVPRHPPATAAAQSPLQISDPPLQRRDRPLLRGNHCQQLVLGRCTERGRSFHHSPVRPPPTHGSLL